MKLILTLLFAGTIAFASETRVFTGTITDSMCGMDHKHMNISPDDKCVQKCVRMSAQYKYVLYDGKNSYRLSDQEVRREEGEGDRRPVREDGHHQGRENRSSEVSPPAASAPEAPV